MASTCFTARDIEVRAVELIDGPVHQFLEERAELVFAVYGPLGARLEEGDGLGNRGPGDDPVRNGGHFGLEPMEFVPAPLVGLLGVDGGTEGQRAGQCVPFSADRIRGLDMGQGRLATTCS